MIMVAALLPKGRKATPIPPPPGGASGVMNEHGQVVVNENGDAPVGGD